MKFGIKRREFIIFSMVGAIILLSLVLRLGNLNHDLWYDESGQLWIAKGQNHFNLDFKDNGLDGLLSNNRQFNFDPPLFGLILRFWSKIDTSIIWLRLLPSLFGLLTIVYIYKTLRFLKINSMILILITLLATLSNIFIYYSQELRAYALGMLSSVMVFYYLTVYLSDRQERQGYWGKPLIKLTASTIIAVSSLYSLWLLVFVSGLFVFLKGLRKKNLWDFIMYILPVFAVATLIFFNQIIYQAEGFNLGYTDEYKIGSYPTLSAILQKTVQLDLGYIYYIFNLPDSVRSLALFVISSPIYLVFFLGTSFFLLFFLFRLILLAPNLLKIPVLFYIVLLLEIHLLSLLNKFPLGGNRWNLFHGPIFLIFLGVILHLILKKAPAARILTAFVLLTLIFINGFNAYNNPRKVSDMEDVLSAVDLNSSLIYLFSYGAVPTFKYHYRYDYHSFDLKLVYYNHRIVNDPDISVLDLNNFFEGKPFYQNQLMKKLTIVLSNESFLTENRVRAIIKNNADKNYYFVKEYSSGSVLAFIISASGN